MLLDGHTVCAMSRSPSLARSSVDAAHLAALRTYWKRHACFPSMPKLCDVLSLRSTASVFGVVGRLTEAGYLQRVDRRIAPTKKFFARRLLPANWHSQRPEPDEAPELITLDDYLMDSPERSSFAKVRDDGMKGEGIFAGDMVVFECNVPTRPGDTVVAIVEGQPLVRTLQLDQAGNYFLQPSNPAYQPFVPEVSLEVLGVVIGMFRKTRVASPQPAPAARLAVAAAPTPP